MSRRKQRKEAGNVVAMCAAARYWNAHPTPDTVRAFDTRHLDAMPEGYGREPLPGELGPISCAARHVIEVTPCNDGRIHYRLLHQRDA